MATTIVTKSGSGAPTASDLVAGELAVDLTNGRLYTEDSGGTVLELGLNPSGNVDVTGSITADGLTVDGAATITANLDVGADNGLGGKLSIQTSSYGVLQDMRTLVAGGINPYLTISSSADGITFEENGSQYKSLMFKTGATERMRIDASGNVGINVASPADTFGGSGTLDAGGPLLSRGVLGQNQTNAGVLQYGSNVTTIRSYGATAGSGIIAFNTGGGGVADTERMRIDASGNVGIGASSPSSYPVAPNLVVDAGGNGGITIKTGSSNYGGVFFADGTTGNEQYRGFIQYNHDYVGSTDELKLGTAGATRMTIDSSGNVGIGRTPSSVVRLSVAGSDTGSSNYAFEATNSSLATKFIVRNDGMSAFYKSDNSESMRIDSSGNVGIGVVPSAWWTGFEALQLGESAALTGRNGGVEQCNLTSNAVFDLTDVRYEYVMGASNEATLYQQADGTHRFNTAPAGTAGNPITFTESMRIDTSGNLLVGRTSDGATGNGHSIRGGNSAIFSRDSSGESMIIARNASAGDLVRFYCNNLDKGSIDFDGSNTISYTSSSDQRLKENIADADDAGNKIDAIQVRKFDWKADGAHQDYGMVAQELQVVAPEAVSGDPESDEMMGVDYSKLVPMMLKEIQSLRARIAALES